MALQKIPRTLLNTGFADSSDATAITINSSEEVGIGTTSPSSAKLVVSGAKTQSGGAPIGCVLIADSTSLAANVGGGITFQGVYHTGGNITGLASIEAMKETATHNQYGGALVLKTREDQGSMNEAMRIDSTGKVGIGTSSSTHLLELVRSSTDFGPTLEINNTSSANGSTGSVRFVTENESTGFIMGKHSNGFGTADLAFINQELNADLAIYTNNTEKMRITSAGNVGIGDTSPGTQLHITSNTAGVNAVLTVQNLQNNRESKIQLLDESDGGGLVLDYDNGGNAAYIKNNVNGALSIYLGGTGTANELNDYEEGTWTPTFSGATLSTAVGSYTKIGNQVTVHYRIVTSGGLPSSGSQVQIGGLPFSISSDTINSVASGFGGAGSVYVGPSNVTSAQGGGGTIVSFASGGESVLRYVNVDTGTLGYTLMGELEITANNVVTAIGTHTYQV